MKKILVFLLELNLLLIPFLLIDTFVRSFPHLQEVVACFVEVLLKTRGNVSRDGIFVFSWKGNELVVKEITFDCTGWKSMYLVSSLTLLTPICYKRKLQFLLLSIPSVFFVNLVRIAFLPDCFFILPSLFSLFIWLAWIKLEKII